MAYKFKAAFADVSAIVHYADTTKEVTAANLNAEDAAQLIAQGQGHLLEVVSDSEAADAASAATPQLSTATTQLIDEVPAPAPAIVAVAEDAPSDVELHDAAELVARQDQADNEATIVDAS